MINLPTLPAVLERNLPTIAIATMMVFVCVLSYFFFSTQSLRLDESQSLWQTSHTPLSILTVVAEDVHVPLYHELLHVWRVFVGDSVGSSRALSLVFFLFSIPAIYFLGKKAYNESIGLWSALFLTVSPFMNWYGNEIRMYSLFTLMVILNQYFFIEIWKNQKRDTWFWYAVTALFGIYSHYFFFLNLAAQVVFFGLRYPLFPKRSFRKFITTAAVLVVCFIPWGYFVIYLNQISNQTPTLTVPSTVNLFGVFQQFLIGFQGTTISTLFVSLWPLLLAFGFLALQRHQRMTAESEYFMLSVFVPILLAFGVSYAVTPVFISRYLILVVPALYLCVLALFTSFPTRIAWASKIGLVILMLITMGVEIKAAGTPVKENYREASEYLTNHAKPQDVVIISAPFTVYPIEYYYHGSAPLSTLPLWNQYAHGPIPTFSEATLPAQVASSTQGVQNVWLLMSYDQGYQKNIQDYFDSHYQRLSTKTFSPGLVLSVYKIRYDAPLSSITPTF
jgi:mannosyltransferase